MKLAVDCFASHLRLQPFFWHQDLPFIVALVKLFLAPSTCRDSVKEQRLCKTLDPLIDNAFEVGHHNAVANNPLWFNV